MKPAVETKIQARRRARSYRRSLTCEQQESDGQALAEVLCAHIPAQTAVAGYLATPGEPDLGPFLFQHWARGGQVVVPVVADVAHRRLQWVQWEPDIRLVPGLIAHIEEPVGQGLSLAQLAQVQPVHVLIPALAVDTAGARLGQGGGFYDTTLTEVPALTGRLTAVVHRWEVHSPGTFEVEPHDLQVRWIATADGIRAAG